MCAPLGLAPAPLANIRLSRNGASRANTLAYSPLPSVTRKNRFYNIGSSSTSNCKSKRDGLNMSLNR